MTQPEDEQPQQPELESAAATSERRLRVPKRTDRAPLGLVSRREAARMCGVSLGTFDLHVRPELAEKKIGRLVAFKQAELEAWAAREPEPKAEPVAAPRRTYTAVSAPVVDMNDPKVRETLERLRASRARKEAREAAQAAKVAANRPKAP